MTSEQYKCSKCNREFLSEEELSKHTVEMSDAHDFIHDR